MIRLLASAALALGVAFAAPALAQGAGGDMTPAEREAFRAEVRAYLLDNPEVLVEALEIYEQRQQVAAAERDAAMLQTLSDRIFAAEDDWVGGNPDGDITIVEFMDYRCGYCRRAYPDVEELVASDGNIRLIVKEFPILGEQSVLASRFAVATLQVAGAEAYKAVHDELMTMQGDINELSLELVAEDLGLDVDAIVARMQDDAVTRVIAENHELAQQLQINGTPSFIFGDEMVRGYVPLEAMRQIVAEERADG
jgi:protein-disulfide isomerase